MGGLTCYKLRTPPGGPVGDFDDAIDEQKLASLRIAGPVVVGSGTAKLFVTSTPPHPPDWASFLRAGFGEDAAIPPVSGAGAVLVIRLERSEGPYLLAFTFGYGFVLLRPNAYERGFGLKTCLNAVFEGDDGTDRIDPARLRSVDSKRVGPTILRARHQASDSGALEDLDVDARRDLLRGVIGTPMDQDLWGTRITGKDSLQLGVTVAFDEIGDLCRRIADVNEAGDYGVRFSFVDDLQLELDRNQEVSAGPTILRGRAWSPQGTVSTVEYSIDGGRWRPARLVGPNLSWAWVRFEVRWHAASGPHSIRTRATDDRGRTQPDEVDWNDHGYLYGGIVAHAITVTG